MKIMKILEQTGIPKDLLVERQKISQPNCNFITTHPLLKLFAS